MSIFKGNLNSANMFTANDDIRGLRLIAPGSLPSFWGVECADGEDWYFWVNDSSNLVMHTAAPTSTYDSVGTVIGGSSTAGANAALSNLSTTTAINTSLVSDADGADNLGSTSYYWAATYTDILYLSSAAYMTANSSAISITGSVTTSGTLTLGADGTDVDMILYGETTGQYVKWDGNAYSDAGMFHIRDNVRLAFGAASATTGDVYMYGDGTDLVIEAAIDDVVIRSGAASDVDWVWESKSSATNDACWTADTAIFQLAGAAKLHFGGTAALDGGTDGVAMVWDESDTLNIDPINADDIIRIGETTVANFHLDGADYDMYWDGSESELLFNDNAKLVFGGTADDLVIKSDGTDVHLTFGAVTNKITIDAYAAQTVAMLAIDGGTVADWDGADNVGMLHLNHDTAMIHAGATMLYLGSSGAGISSADGIVMRIEESGTNAVGSYVAEFYSAANNFLHMHTGATGVTPLTISPHTNATASAIAVDAYTDGFVGAANTGLVNINGKGTLAAATASLLHINPTGAYAANGEGGALFINDDKTASSTNYSVYVNSNLVNCMKLETEAKTMKALTCEPATSATASVVYVNGDANGWVGAASTGMVHIDNDVAQAANTASMLYLDNTGAAVASHQGICLRIVDSGTTATTAYAAYVSSTSNHCMSLDTGATGVTALTISPHTNATASGLKVDAYTDGFVGVANTGLVNIAAKGTLAATTTSLLHINPTGAYAANGQGGALFINDDKTASSTNYSVYVNSNLVNCMKLETEATSMTPLTLKTAASATADVLKIDGDSNGWIGAAGAAQLHIDNDVQMANQTASMLFLDNTGAAAISAQGTCLRVVDTGTSASHAYATYITSTSNAGMLISSGTSDHYSLFVTNTAVGGTGIMAQAGVASTTASLIAADGSTNNWVGAANTGMINAVADGTLGATSASLLRVDFDGTYAAGTEGGCLLIDDDGTAAGTDYSVYVNSNAVNCMKLETVAQDMTALTVECAASATASLVKVTGDANGWTGADDTGMVHIDNDVQTTGATATLLFLDNTGASATGQSGICMRAVDTGTKASAGIGYAAEINSTNNDGLIIKTGATTGTPMTLQPHTSTVSEGLIVDGDTNGFVGAANVGLVEITQSGTLADVAASALIIDFNGTYAANGHGGCLYIDDDGTAGGTDYSVYVNSLGVNCMKLETMAKTMTALTLEGAQSATASVLYVTGDANGWAGADSVGMVHIDNDVKVADESATLLYLDNTGAAATGQYGICMRAIDTGTIASTGTAYTAEFTSTNNDGLLIKTGAVTGTQATLQCHTNATAEGLIIDGDTNGFVGAANVGLVEITQSGTLADVAASALIIDFNGTYAAGGHGGCLYIDDDGTAGGTDYSVYVNSLGVNCMKLETGAKTMTALTLECAASATASVLHVDGDSNDWIGAASTGMVHIDNDAIIGNKTGSLLYIDNTGGAATSAGGSCLRIVDSGAAATDAYVAYISSSSNEALWVDAGKVKIDESLVASTGVTFGDVSVTASTAGTASTIPDGTSYATITSGAASNYVILPTPTVGTVVWLYESTNGYELRTDTPASVAINGGVGDSVESAIAAGYLVRAVCVSSTKWICTQFGASGDESNVALPDV